MVGLDERARRTVEPGLTDPAEVRRVLGISSRARAQPPSIARIRAHFKFSFALLDRPCYRL